MTATALTARQRTISHILRVNHAGEHGAISIYRSQLWFARLFRLQVADALAPMLENERAHIVRFRALMTARGLSPCAVLPLWGVGGSMLGLITSLLGRRGVMVCTTAVERTVHRHLEEQLIWLGSDDPDISTTIGEILDDELEHLAYARANHTPRGLDVAVIDAAVATISEALIWLSTNGASTAMARDFRRAA